MERECLLSRRESLSHHTSLGRRLGSALRGVGRAALVVATAGERVRVFRTEGFLEDSQCVLIERDGSFELSSSLVYNREIVERDSDVGVVVADRLPLEIDRSREQM